MRMTRRQLKKLIREAFIADEYGNTRYIGKQGGANFRHQYADDVMVKSDPLAFEDPEYAKKTYDMYELQRL